MGHWDTAEEKVNEADKQYVAKSFNDPEDGIITVLIKWHCEGLSEEHWMRWKADPTAIAAATN